MAGAPPEIGLEFGRDGPDERLVKSAKSEFLEPLVTLRIAKALSAPRAERNLNTGPPAVVDDQPVLIELSVVSDQRVRAVERIVVLSTVANQRAAHTFATMTRHAGLSWSVETYQISGR
jgi:hypothetical protein